MDWFSTPDDLPETKREFLLSIPDNPDIIACVLGALNNLAYTSHWYEDGSVTPAAMAEAMRDMIGSMLETEVPVATIPGLQTRVDLWQHFAVSIVGNAFTRSINTSQVFNSLPFQNAAANGDAWHHTNIWLRAGVYKCRLLHVKSSASGILELFLVHEDGSPGSEQIGGVGNQIDLYNATSIFGQIYEANVTVPTDGEWRLQGFITGKRAASTGFQCLVTLIEFIRTGD